MPYMNIEVEQKNNTILLDISAYLEASLIMIASTKCTQKCQIPQKYNF
jgi:hypothetical protein